VGEGVLVEAERGDSIHTFQSCKRSEICYDGDRPGLHCKRGMRIANVQKPEEGEPQPLPYICDYFTMEVTAIVSDAMVIFSSFSIAERMSSFNREFRSLRVYVSVT